MANKILDFLFGKDAQIFNRKGRVEHDLGKTKWEKWDNRFSENPNYDFQEHRGQRLKKNKDSSVKPK